MTKQETIKKYLSKGLFNLKEIERQSGIRPLKLYEFKNNKAKLSDTETNTVLTIIRNATKLH